MLMFMMSVLTFMIEDTHHAADDDTDDDTDDDANDDTDDDADGVGRGNRRPPPGGTEFIS